MRWWSWTWDRRLLERSKSNPVAILSLLTPEEGLGPQPGTQGAQPPTQRGWHGNGDMTVNTNSEHLQPCDTLQMCLTTRCMEPKMGRNPGQLEVANLFKTWKFFSFLFVCFLWKHQGSSSSLCFRNDNTLLQCQRLDLCHLLALGFLGSLVFFLFWWHAQVSSAQFARS